MLREFSIITTAITKQISFETWHSSVEIANLGQNLTHLPKLTESHQDVTESCKGCQIDSYKKF